MNIRLAHPRVPFLIAGAFLLLAPVAIATETGLNSADTEFIQEEAASAVAMVRIASLGVKKSGRADIRTHAGAIIADRTQGIAEIAKLAGRKGVGLTAEIDANHANNYQTLRGMSGPRFDKNFLSAIVNGHTECIRNFEEAAERAVDEEVRSWAAKTLPSLRAHLERAEALSSKNEVKTSAPSSEKSTARPAN